MTPDEKQRLTQEFEAIVNQAYEKSDELLTHLKTTFATVFEKGKLDEHEDLLNDAIGSMEDLLERLHFIFNLIQQDAIDEDYQKIKEEIISLITSYKVDYEEAFRVNEQTSKDEDIELPLFSGLPQVDLKSIVLINSPVNLSYYPQVCLPYGYFLSGAVKLGDSHACLPKILHIALKTGVAKIEPTKYGPLVQQCNLLGYLDSLKTTRNPQETLALQNEGFKAIEFHPLAIILFLGDLFMDRYGNDLSTGRLFKRIDECGTRKIITLSNHDALFIYWLFRGMPEISFMKKHGQSSQTFKYLIDKGITNTQEMWELLNQFYFNDLVLLYYEISPDNILTNISSHAPVGEWEIYEMAQGLYEYSIQPQYADLFTESQKSRLMAASAIPYDSAKGLNSLIFRSFIDLINEILHTNAIKPNKKDLCDLINLGCLELTHSQLNGQGINPRKSPIHYCIWNKETPRIAPSQGEPRTFLNGHHYADALNPSEELWVHKNVSLDDMSGKGPALMDGQLMRYILPVAGYTPMPRIVLPPEATVAQVTRARAVISEPSRERDRSPPPRNK